MNLNQSDVNPFLKKYTLKGADQSSVDCFGPILGSIFNACRVFKRFTLTSESNFENSIAKSADFERFCRSFDDRRNRPKIKKLNLTFLVKGRQFSTLSTRRNRLQQRLLIFNP